MRILVIQLARFGDILQTWPTLRALKRTFPEAQVDVLVREKFAEAASHCDSIDRIIKLDTKAILAPCFSDQQPEVVLQESVDQLDDVLEQLHPEYDRIINLSYSPLSSYITHLLKGHSEDIRGYNRFADGYLSLPDEASSYFYAQVGTDRTNRLHLTDIFAATAGLTLEIQDFQYPQLIAINAPSAGRHLVVHVGASDAQKNCQPAKWLEIVTETALIWPETIYLVGTANESISVAGQLPENVIDLCGATTFKDLFQLVGSSQGLIACDSMLVQIANLCQVPTVNLSHRSVSYWETGPRVQGSRIIQFSDAERLQGPEVACIVTEMLNGTHLFKNAAKVERSYDHEAILAQVTVRDEFQWVLTKALYFEQGFPVIHDMKLYKAFAKIHELAELGLEQIDCIQKKQNLEVAAGILDYIDGLMASIVKIERRVSPVVRWFQTEKLRIGPGEIGQIIDQSEALFQTLKKICAVYVVKEKASIRKQEIDNGNCSL